jgi:LAO/AO transport system kinase
VPQVDQSEESLQAAKARHLVERVVSGDRVAAGRCITHLEDDSDLAAELMSRFFAHTGHAYRVGITGPPGAGKSTLVDRLALECRKRSLRVGILSVDPSSPFTRGALLGDRVRMAAATADTGVFMRSMASRGALGGLARTTLAAADVLDAAGYDIIFFETVGVGQSELEVCRAVDATVVVLTPESGSGVQMIKAGLMEIADVLVLNKADRQAASQMEAEMRDFLDIVEQGRLMRGRQSLPGRTVAPQAVPAPRLVAEWEVPLVRTVATTDEGVATLTDALQGYRAYLEASGLWQQRRQRQARARLREQVTARLELALWEAPQRIARFERLVDGVASGHLEPSAAAQQFLEEVAAEGLLRHQLAVPAAHEGQAEGESNS